MARFSGQIKSAKFVDKEEKVVEVLYGEDPKSLTAFNVSVDYNSPVFTDLLDEVSFEQIQDNTKQHFDNIINTRNNIIHHAATEMFEEWIKNAQEDLDKQDAERYRIFEEYKNTVIETLQLEADKQVLERVNEEYEKIQAEVDRQAEEQVKKEYEKIDQYKKEQLELMQKDVDIQIEERYKEVDGYKLQQLEKARKELKKNFNVVTPAKPSITTNDLINAFLEKTEDEDLLFKTKLELFNKSEVKNHKDRDLKMKIRKAKTIPELFAAYQECIT